MKGKLFKSKPLPPKNEILDFFCMKAKPWEKITEKTYNWRSSIPDKWVSLKGENYFKHSSEIKHPRLSIELLQNTKKYIHHFRVSSQEVIPVMPTLTFDKKSKQSPIDLPKRRSSLPITIKSPEKSLLITGESNTNGIVHNSRPSTVREARNNPQTNNKIDEFLKRFDNKPVIKEHSQINKGLIGWKLKHLKEIKEDSKKNNFFLSFGQKSDTPASKFNSKRVTSIS
jgi:hypothetical protein